MPPGTRGLCGSDGSEELNTDNTFLTHSKSFTVTYISPCRLRAALLNERIPRGR